MFFKGLTLQQSTDPKTLKKELEKLDRQLRELNIAHQTRYVPKDVKIKLKEQLASKVSLMMSTYLEGQSNLPFDSRSLKV